MILTIGRRWGIIALLKRLTTRFFVARVTDCDRDLFGIHLLNSENA